MDRPTLANTAAFLGLDPDRSALRQLGARRLAGMIVAIVLLFVGLRCVNLAADPPRSFGPRPARELVAEPAAKSHEARNYALFGTYHLNEADEYQFWRAQSPVWVYPLSAFFKAFGVDWPQLRLFSTLYSALGLAAMLFMAARFVGPWVLGIIGSVLVFDRVYFHYARAGLLEPAVNTWLAVCMLALILAERRALWLVAAHWAFALSFFTKQAAVIVVPLLAVASLRVLLRSSDREPEMKRARLVVLGNIVVVCALAAIYVMNSDYWRAVEHNVNHVLLGSDAPNEFKYKGLRSIFTRIAADGRYSYFIRTIPWTGSLGLIGLVALAVEVVRTRRFGYAPMVMLGWFASSIVAMLGVAWSAMRFWSLTVLPAALAAALVLEAVFAALRKRGFVRVPGVVGLAAALVLIGSNLYRLRETLLQPEFTVRDGAAAIMHAIGPVDATVVGARSPPMVLGTPYKNFYVRASFNSSRERLEQLAPTHFLFLKRRDGSREIVRRELPSVARSMVRVLDLKVRGEELRLFAGRDGPNARRGFAGITHPSALRGGEASHPSPALRGGEGQQ